MICPFCHFVQVIARAVDGREQYACLRCSRRWYSQRANSTVPDQILDRIADAVASSGVGEEKSMIMANHIWRDGYGKRLREWCLAHGFVCTRFFRSAQGRGLGEQYLRFTWATSVDSLRASMSNEAPAVEFNAEHSPRFEGASSHSRAEQWH